MYSLVQSNSWQKNKTFLLNLLHSLYFFIFLPREKFNSLWVLMLIHETGKRGVTSVGF